MDNKPTNPKDVVGIMKVPASCVSQLVLAEVGVAMLEGALKYGRHNYRGVGVRGSVYFDATQRHLNAWWEGQDIDPMSGLNHITKAITSLIVLRDAMIMGLMEDDRPPAHKDLQAFLDDLEAKCVALRKTYGDRKPYHYTELGQQHHENPTPDPQETSGGPVLSTLELSTRRQGQGGVRGH